MAKKKLVPAQNESVHDTASHKSSEKLSKDRRAQKANEVREEFRNYKPTLKSAAAVLLAISNEYKKIKQIPSAKFFQQGGDHNYITMLSYRDQFLARLKAVDPVERKELVSIIKSLLDDKSSILHFKEKGFFGKVLRDQVNDLMKAQNRLDENEKNTREVGIAKK